MKETDTKVGGIIHGEGLDLKYHAPTDEFISICTKMDSGCNEPNKVKNGANANPHANTKMDSGKIRWHLIPWRLMRDVAYVFGHGANIHGEDNWKNDQGHHAIQDRYFSAAMRHIMDYRMGIWIDDGEKGSGKPHLAHAICSLLILWWHSEPLIRIPEKSHKHNAIDRAENGTLPSDR